MKIATFLSLLIVTFLSGFGLRSLIKNQYNETMTNTEKANRMLSEEMIRKTEATYDQAWKHGDIEGIMSCFSHDAILISPRGDVAIGTEQIRSLLSNFLEREAQSTTHTSQINRISFVTDEVAVVDGDAYIQGTEKLSHSDKHHSFTDILVRSGETWLITHIRAYAVNK